MVKLEPDNHATYNNAEKNTERDSFGSLESQGGEGQVDLGGHFKS